MSFENNSNKVNFQDALPFYRDMYFLKLECIKSGEQATPDKPEYIIDYYKKIFNIFRYAYAYIEENRIYREKLTALRERLQKEFIVYQTNKTTGNKEARYEQKENLRQIIEELINIELHVFVSLKNANLELPITKRNIHHSIQESDIS
jgi:regulator of replication initiation timing